MKQQFVWRMALLCAVLSLAAGNMQAATRTVTSATVLYTGHQPGQLLYEIGQLQNGDVLTFDTTQVKTINLSCVSKGSGKPQFLSYKIEKTVTVLGNGITFTAIVPEEYKSDMSIFIAQNMISKWTFTGCRVENVHFEMPMMITSARLVNCTFKPDTYLTDQYSIDCASSNYIEGCAFLSEGDRMAWVQMRSGQAHFTSCTVINETNHRTCIRQTGNASVTFTNCVLLDAGATDASPSVSLYNIASKGYNVFQGVMKPLSGGPAWTPAVSDETVPLDATELPLTFDGGIYKVTADGAAYRRLPANPTATIEALAGVTFPEKDLSGDAIEYNSGPVHSGAWQTVYGDEGAGNEVVVTDIRVNFPDDGILFTDTTWQFSAAVFSAAGNATQEVVWECTVPGVTLTPSGTGNLAAAFRAEGFTEDTPITVKLTAADNGADGQPFAKTFTLTVKPCVHVSGITLTDLPVTFGYERGLRAVVLPANANWKELEWTVADPAVAALTVHPGSDSITVKGLTAGTTTLTATARDNSVAATATVTVSRPDYSDGVFIVNEDWFGHSPGSVNFLHSDGRIDHNAFKHANHTPFYELGSVAQYGAIYGDRFYLISKNGFRFTVADARTLELHRSFAALGGEGRFFFGVDEHTGYVGTANGIRIVNLDALPDVPGDHVENGQTDPKRVIILPGQDIASIQSGGGTYTGQIATMKRVGERIFALQQGVLHVITAAGHRVETTLDDHVYVTLTQSKDGYLWLGTSGQVPDGTVDADSDEANLTNYFVRLDPWTLEQQVITLPAGITGSGSTFGAWQADAFQGSAQDNVLYWKSGDRRILRYDIDANRTDTVLDLSGMPLLPGVGAPWTLYGTSFAVDHRTGELIVTTGTYVIDCCINDRNNWKILRVDPNGGRPRADAQGVTGNILAEYPLRQHYWFPAMPVFPDVHRPEFTDVEFPAALTLSGAHPTDSLNLWDKVADADNMRAAIVTTVPDGYDKSLVNAFIRRDTLVVAARKTIPAGQPARSTVLTLKFNSNGHVITRTLTVTLTGGTTVPDEPGGTEENPFELTQQTLALYPGQTAQLALTAPQHFSTAWRSTVPSVAAVSTTGLVTTLAAGTTRIIARDAATGKADTCLVTVSALPSTTPQPPAYTLALNTTELRLIQGERAALQVTVTPQQPGQTPAWSSSNPSVADVTATGTVIALSPGTAQLRATLGAASAVCLVTVGAQVTQPVVGNIGNDAAQLTFPRVAGASYYLAHLYELKSGGILPVLTLKITPDGRVTLRSTVGNNLIVPLSYLSPATAYVVYLETLRETGGKAEVIQTEVTGFKTQGAPTGLLAPDAATPRAYHAGGVLCLERLEGFDCTLSALSGQTVRQFRVTGVSERRPLALSPGVYLLTATDGERRMVFKLPVR